MSTQTESIVPVHDIASAMQEQIKGNRPLVVPPNLDMVQDRPLRDYQQRAVEATVATLKDHDRANLVMACGTGKTLTTARIIDEVATSGVTEWEGLDEQERKSVDAEGLLSEAILVLVPSLALAAQTWMELSKTIPAHYAIFGSSGPGERSIEDHVDVLVTTDPDELTLKMCHPFMGRRIIISTYHSAPKLAEAQRGIFVETGSEDFPVVKFYLPTFSIILADEAHKISGKTESSDWTAALGDRIKARKRLFATATPTSGENAMDDESLFGPRAYTYDMRTAVNDGWLSDFHVVAIGVRAGQSREGSLIHALLTAARDYNLTQVASFHSTLEDAEAFTGSLNASGHARSDFLAGSHTWTQRQQMLTRLAEAESLHVLTSVNTISEGVNVPTLDGVVFAAPRSSPVQVTQILGRAIRLNPKRSEPSVILVPVYLPEGEDVDKCLADADFSDLRDIIRGIQEHDPTFISKLGRERFGDSGHGGDETHTPQDSMISVLDPTGLVNLDEFHTRVLEESAGSERRWYEQLRQCADFLSEHGRHPSRSSTDEYEDRLGRWFTIQKRAYLAGDAYGRVTVSEERRRAFDENLPGWASTTHDAVFEDKLNRLVAFIEAHQCWPKLRGQRQEDEKELHNFLKNQRLHYKHGTNRGKPMDPAKIAALDARIPHWLDPWYYG